MNRLSLPIAILLSFGLGWFAAKKFSSEPVPASPIENPVNEKAAEAQRLLESSAKDIAAIEDEHLRRQKAEELLERMLKLFMIDLSLRLQKTGDAAGSAATTAKSAPAPGTNQASDRQPAPAPSTSTDPASAAGKDAAAKLTAERIRQFELLIVESDDRAELNRALRELGKQNFDGSYQASKSPTPQQAEALFGTYSGQVSFFDEGRRPWSVRMSLSHLPTSTPENPSYNSRIHITDGAGKTSTSSGRGSLKGFNVGSVDPLMFFIEAGDNLFQLYKSKVSAGLSGLVYDSDGKGMTKPVGRIHLTQRN